MLGLVPKLSHASLTLIVLVERRSRETWIGSRQLQSLSDPLPRSRLTFPNTARELGHTVCQSKDGLLRETACAPGDPNPEVLVAVHHDAVVRLDEEVGHSAGHVGEQSDGVPEEVGRSEDTVELPEEFLTVVEREAFLQDGEREADVLDDEGVEADRCIVDVAKRHREGVDEEDEGVASVQPGGRLAGVEKLRQEDSLLVDVDTVRSHEAEVELDRLEVEDFKVDVASARRRFRIRNVLGLVGEFPIRNTVSDMIHRE